MASNSIYRMGTATMYDTSRQNLMARQTNLSNLQENLTSGKRVVRASDDPVAAAQAERALTRISRIQSEQRNLETQRNAVAQTESTLGDVVETIQSLRELVVSAGNGGFKAEDRKTVALQLQGLREQLTNLANRKDTNGVPLLAALGSTLSPFLGPLSGSPDYKFDGLPGQNASTGVTIPNTLDGHSTFMFDPQRDGVYGASVSATNPSRTLLTSGIRADNPALVTGDNYQISFSGVGPGATAGTTTAQYTITNTTTGAVSAPVTVPDFPNGKASITVTGIPGLSFEITGTPDNGDTIDLQPSPSLFSSIDTAIRDIGQSTNTNTATQAVAQALAGIDKGLERISNMRGYAGELLNRADRITGDQENRAIQLEGDRSRVEDLDMLKGISEFQNSQVGYEAALKSYAMVQKLSLFNFLG